MPKSQPRLGAHQCQHSSEMLTGPLQETVGSFRLSCSIVGSECFRFQHVPGGGYVAGLGSHR